MWPSVCTLPLVTLLMSTSVNGLSTIGSYPCPEECECIQRKNDLLIVDVVCRLPKIDLKSNFSVLQTDIPTVLYIVCDPSYTSELKNYLFKDLKSVITLKLIDCKFSLVPNHAFYGMDSVDEITIHSAKNLKFERQAFVGRKRLSKLYITNSQVEKMADLCQVSSLILLNFTENHLSNMSNAGLSCAYNTVLPKLSTLILNKNLFQTLGPEFGNAIPNLWQLSIANNHIISIDPNAIKYLTNLGWLDLTNNSIHHLPLDFLLGKSNLKILGLGQNPLGHLDDGFFSFSAKLFILDLTNTNVNDSIWRSLSTLRQIKQLELGLNLLKRIDRSILNQSPHLRYLDLRGNNITRISEEVFVKQENLQTLILSDNQISRLDLNALTGLKSLTKLDLSINNINFVDVNAFSHLESLRKLNLSFNFLRELPDMKSMTNLKIFDMRSNRIENITETVFDGMLRLEEVNMQFNLIGAIFTGIFQKAPSLKYIQLANNKIEMIEGRAFDGLPQLTQLILCYNRIKVLDGVFSYLPNLVHLDLSGNNITSAVRDGLFPYSVKYLNLSGNRITKLSTYSFYKYENLISVDLRYNKIRTFGINEIAVSRNLEHPSSIFIVGNPLVCDCELKWLRKRIDVVTSNTGEPYLEDLDDVMCQKGYRVTSPVSLRSINPVDMMCEYSYECKSSSCMCCDFQPCICSYKCPDYCSCYKSESDDGNSVVVCSESNKTSIPEGIPSIVKRLYMDGNNITTVYRGIFLDLMHLKEMYLNNSGIIEIENGSFVGLNQLQQLYLQNNYIKEIMSDTFEGAENLLELHLEYNEIAYIEDGTFDSMLQLRSLYLAHNHLLDIPDSIKPLESTVQIFTFSGNVWPCECEVLSMFRQHLSEAKRKVKDLSDIKCVLQSKQNMSSVDYNEVILSTSVLEIDMRSFCPEVNITDDIANTTVGRLEEVNLRTTVSNFVVIVAICAGVVLFTLVFVVIYWRWTLFHRCTYYLPYDNSDFQREYDAFLSYSRKDADFVTKEFLPNLENIDTNYRLCLLHRDTLIGQSTAGSIKTNTDKSKTIILIISNAFLDDEWRQKDFRSAHAWAFAKKDTKLAIVLLQNIDFRKLNRNVKSILKVGTYIRYADKMFWEKINSFMPEKTKSETRVFSNMMTPDLLQSVGDDLPIFDEGYETPISSSTSQRGNSRDSGFDLGSVNNIYEEIGPKRESVA